MFAGLFCFAYLALGAGIPNTGPASFKALFEGIAKAVGGIIAALGTVMFIISGAIYVTSGGNPQRMDLAKKTLIYAIIGMVVGLAATAIVDWVAKIVS